MKNILNVEGIPGSGKSTTAEQLDDSFRQHNIDSYWIDEIAKDHPIRNPKSQNNLSEKDFISTSLTTWQSFVSDNLRVAILDGYALQSTVRFLFAMNASEKTIQEFFREWQEIGDSCSSMVFLKVLEPEKHFGEFVFPLRGKEWCRKLSSYVSSTPYGVAHELTGLDGIIKFWSEYQTICLDLLVEPTTPTQIRNHSERDWIQSYWKSML